ncbi:hypothetical protein [Kytococcus sp. Marseille-QA3725]
MTVRVTPAASRADLRAFCRLPGRLHPRSHHVPLLEPTIADWYRGRGPAADHGEVELLLARDAMGAVVGRTTVHSDDRMDARLGRMTTLLGATEFATPQVLDALVGAAIERAEAAGRTALLGPVSLLPNQTGGVVTAGHDEPGFLDSAWNPSWYPAAWEGAGFEPLWPGATWICEDLASRDATADLGPDESLPEGLELHRGSRRHLAEQLPLLRTMLNASFAELPYYTPISAPELEAATDGLSHLLDEDLLLYLTDHGRPVAFVLVVPDITDFVRSTGGRMALCDQARLWLTRRRYRREAVLIIKGTVPSARGRGLMRRLSRQLLVNLQASGYETLRVTQVGQENAASAAHFAAIGGRPLHELCFYRKELV